jgi:hypothetical protein
VDEEVAQQSRYTRWAGDSVHGRYPATTPVWVRLDLIYARIPGAPHHVIPEGLDMTGEVPGLLSTWFASAKGDWMGVVTYQIPYADGRRDKLALRDQLVPSYALRERIEPGAQPGPERV